MANGKVTFGPYEFEPVSGRLSKRGNRLKLQPKPQAILACLLENPGALVKREDLQRRLWPAGTFVDFDLGLNVAIKKLRDALDDSADTPVYVQTIPGEGYRFIAPVIAAAFAKEVPPPRIPRRPGLYWMAALLALGVAVISLMTALRSTPLNFQSRDWVLIAAFENRTGEKVFDGSMEYALEREVSESRYVNVVPSDRINDTLTLMRQKPGSLLTEELARQVAVRDGGIKAVLGGRVEKFGQGYVLTVRLLDPSTGNAAAVFSERGGLEQLPEAVRRASDQLRRKLGETAFEQPASALEKATTPSLAALRAFSSGMKFVNEFKWAPAAELMEEAIREDPQFASAHIYAAHSYSNLGKVDLAAPHYRAAFRNAPNASVRERLFILGSYYSRFEVDKERARALYEALVSLYPDDYWGVNNLVSITGRPGMTTANVDMLERLAALRPNSRNTGLLVYLSFYRIRVQPDKTKADAYVRRVQSLRAAGVPGMWWRFDFAGSDGSVEKGQREGSGPGGFPPERQLRPSRS